MQKFLAVVILCLVAIALVEGVRRPNRGGRRGPKRLNVELVELEEECTPTKAREEGCQCTPRRNNWGCDECNRCMCSGRGSWRCHRMGCPDLSEGKCWKPVKYFRTRRGKRVEKTACWEQEC